MDTLEIRRDLVRLRKEIPPMAKRQPPRRIFKSRDVVTNYKGERSAGKLMQQMARDHPDVLQNIEATLVNAHEQDRAIDDRIVSQALGAAMRDVEPKDPLVAELAGALAAVRELREDIADEVWRDALRVVAESVRTHSELAPGETGYLSFVARFVR
jgi:hypothetical protein